MHRFQSSDRVILLSTCIASINVKCTTWHFTMIGVHQCRFVDIKKTINISFYMYQNEMLNNGTYWVVEIIKIVAFNVR